MKPLPRPVPSQGQSRVRRCLPMQGARCLKPGSMRLLATYWKGPLPQTRFVLRKALALGRTPIVVINKIDRPGADPLRVHDEVLDLFIELEADEAQLDAPVVYVSARDGTSTLDLDKPLQDLTPLFEMILSAVPPPPSDATGSFQMLISTIDHSPYLGRLGIGRIERGVVLSKGPRQRSVKDVTAWHVEGSLDVERSLSLDAGATVGVHQQHILDRFSEY